MTKYIYSLFIALCFLPLTGWAQLSEGGTPASTIYRLSEEVTLQNMPSINVRALLAEDEQDLASNLPLRFAFGHEVNLNLSNAGDWETLSNGDRVWRMGVHCPDALNINFLYNDFYLPKGAKLFIYNEDKSQVLGAFTAANNKISRKFATALIHGDVAIIEYYEPQGVSGEGAISIAQIGHGYRKMDGQTNDVNRVSGDCQVNVNCTPEGDDWQDEKKGVARIVMDGLYLCSGSLINNTANDCKPYFLTANHCIMGGIVQDAIVNPDVSGYVFYWNYEYAGCVNSGNLPEQTTSGGTVIANTGIANTGTHTILGSDFALIELAENPRDAYDVYFNGFDATEDQGNTGVGIHHPAGDAKKISTHYKVPLNNGYYWDLNWDPTPNGYSVTEGGSSGSPLFRESSNILGQLFGGGSVNCDDPANDLAKYGKLSYSWTNADHPLSFDVRRRLNVWLDPIGGGSIRSINGTYDPCETPKVYFKSNATNTAESAADTQDGCIEYKEYEIALGITPFPTSVVDVVLFANGSASEGSNSDYVFYPSDVSFNNVTNEQTVTLRVYNDDAVENLEDITLSYSINGTNAAPLLADDLHLVQIADNDFAPNSHHVQAVSNDDNPSSAYIGPFTTVYFFDIANDGVMMKVENLSDFDFGCTEVAVDQAGASANNAWANGSTASKSFTLLPSFSDSEAALAITLYYTQSEIVGWEWFNNQGDDRYDLEIIHFGGVASPANEANASSTATVLEDYNNDYQLTTTISGLAAGITGFTIGSFDNNFQNLNINIQGNNNQSLKVAPNPVQDWLQITFVSDIAQSGQVQVLNAGGQLLLKETVGWDKGLNRVDLSLAQLPSGIYWLQCLEQSGQIKVIKFVKL